MSPTPFTCRYSSLSRASCPRISHLAPFGEGSERGIASGGSKCIPAIQVVSRMRDPWMLGPGDAPTSRASILMRFKHQAASFLEVGHRNFHSHCFSVVHSPRSIFKLQYRSISAIYTAMQYPQKPEQIDLCMNRQLPRYRGRIWPRASLRIADDISHHKPLQQHHVSKTTFDKFLGLWE